MHPELEVGCFQKAVRHFGVSFGWSESENVSLGCKSCRSWSDRGEYFRAVGWWILCVRPHQVFSLWSGCRPPAEA